jgi:uncharacterized protein YoxC
MLVQICIVVATVALLGVSIALIQALGKLRGTADQLERTMARLEQTVPEVERTVQEARDVFATVGRTAHRVDVLAGEFAETGHRIARASSMIVDDVVVPVTRAAAVVRGVRAGASTLVSSILKRRGLRSADSSTGGNHHE